MHQPRLATSGGDAGRGLEIPCLPLPCCRTAGDEVLLFVTERRILGAASQSYRGFVETVEGGERLGAVPVRPRLMGPMRTSDAEILGIGERPVEVGESRCARTRRRDSRDR